METPYADVRTEQLKAQSSYCNRSPVRRTEPGEPGAHREEAYQRSNGSKRLFLSRVTLAYILLLLLFPQRSVLPRARWHQDRISFFKNTYIYSIFLILLLGHLFLPLSLQEEYWFQFLAVRKSGSRISSEDWAKRFWEVLRSVFTRGPDSCCKKDPWDRTESSSDRLHEPHFSWHDLHRDPPVRMMWCFRAAGCSALLW